MKSLPLGSPARTGFELTVILKVTQEFLLGLACFCVGAGQHALRGKQVCVACDIMSLNFRGLTTDFLVQLVSIIAKVPTVVGCFVFILLQLGQLMSVKFTVTIPEQEVPSFGLICCA